MIDTNTDVLNIDTFEEFTMHSLDRSLEGLELLRRGCIECGENLVNHFENQGNFEDFTKLCENLHDFFVFENDVRSMFMIDTDRLRDRRGSLKEVEEKFEATLQELPNMLINNQLEQLSECLRVTLPNILDRYQDLLPALKNHIHDEYVLS